MQVLGAPNLRAMVAMLRARSRRAAAGEGEGEGAGRSAEAGVHAAETRSSNEEEHVALRAGALLLALLYDFFAAWQPRRERPLLRKDFAAEAHASASPLLRKDSAAGAGVGAGAASSAWRCSSVGVPAVEEHACEGRGVPLAIGWQRHVPIVRNIFYVCSEASTEMHGGEAPDRCELP